MEKKLKVYKENNMFVLERINQFNHATKRNYETESGLKLAIQSYKSVLDEYEIETTKETQALVINYLGSKEFSED